MSTYHWRSLAPNFKNSSLTHFSRVIHGCSSVCLLRLNGKLPVTVVNHSFYNKVCLSASNSFYPILHSYFCLSSYQFLQREDHGQAYFFFSDSFRKQCWERLIGNMNKSFRKQPLSAPNGCEILGGFILQGFAQEEPYFTVQRGVTNSTWNRDNTYLPFFFLLAISKNAVSLCFCEARKWNHQNTARPWMLPQVNSPNTFVSTLTGSLKRRTSNWFVWPGDNVKENASVYPGLIAATFSMINSQYSVPVPTWVS